MAVASILTDSSPTWWTNRHFFFCVFYNRHDFYVYVIISSDGNDEIFNETFVLKSSIKLFRLFETAGQPAVQPKLVWNSIYTKTFVWDTVCIILSIVSLYAVEMLDNLFVIIIFLAINFSGNVSLSHQSHFVINFILLRLLIMQNMFVNYERKSLVSRSWWYFLLVDIKSSLFHKKLHLGTAQQQNGWWWWSRVDPIHI